MAEKKRMDLKRVRELIDLMLKNDLVGGVAVDAKTPEEASRPPKEGNEQLIEITSPIVGTFYASPSPDSKPYVKVGSHVDEETVVCIIEAMKVMNEIKAQTTGTIVEVLGKAGQAVEFGQPLFKVRPD